MKSNLQFKKVFIEGERQQIRGRNFINMKILVGIMVLTFLAIGSSNIAIRDLDHRMNDPFVNLFSIEVPYSRQYVVEELKADFADEKKRNEYGFQSISNYVEFPISFLKMNVEEGDDHDIWVKGRSIDLNSPVLDALLNENNLIAGERYNDPTEPGIIVSNQLYEDLGYKDYVPYIYMTFDDEVIPLPVKAVVKDLPESNGFLCLPYFFFQRTENGAMPFKNIDQNTRLVLYHPDRKEENNCLQFLEKFLSEFKEFENYELEIFRETNRETFLEGISYTIKFFGFEPANARVYDPIVDELKKATDQWNFIRIYKLDYSQVSFFELPTDRLAINFRSLEQVRAFRDELYNKYQIEMDLARVLDKENFQAFNLLAQAISYALIIFSILGICFYLYNMLKSHLDKISRNLGTFLAFGLEPKTLYVLYRQLLFSFLNRSVAIATGISFLLVTLISAFSNRGVDLLLLLEFKTLLSLVALYSVFYIIYRMTIYRLLEKTPGDLVYERVI